MLISGERRRSRPVRDGAGRWRSRPAGVDGPVRPAAPRAQPERTFALILLIAAVPVTVALVWAIRDGMIFGFPDANSHLNIARRVFDSSAPSITQLGTHWTPLFQALELPLVWIDPLYHSGAAGVAVSVASSLITAVYLYRLALLLGLSRLVGVVSVIVLVGNPNFDYIGVVPLQHALIMATATANVYYLTRWTIDGSGWSLLMCGLSLTVTTLTHFDTWILAPIEFAIVLVASQARWRSWVHTRATMVLWLLAGGFGIALFLAMNVAIYQDPLAFAHAFKADTGSGLATVGGAPLGGRTGIHGLEDYPTSAWEITGPLLAVLGLIGAAAFAWRHRRSPQMLTALVLFYPLAWYAFEAATTGSLIVPNHSNLQRWHDLRYAVPILPAVAFFSIAGFRRRALILPIAAAVLAFSGWTIADGRVGVWEEALGQREFYPGLAAAGNWIAARAGDSGIFIPVVDDRQDAFERLSGLPLAQFIDSSDTKPWRIARKHPIRLLDSRVHWMVEIRQVHPTEFRHFVRATGAHFCAVFPREAPIVYIFAIGLQRCDRRPPPGPFLRVLTYQLSPVGIPPLSAASPVPAPLPFSRMPRLVSRVPSLVPRPARRVGRATGRARRPTISARRRRR